MAERSQKALTAVEKLYKRKPNATTEEFRAAVEKADPSIKKLLPRSFNARYVLPFKRSAAAKAKPAKKATKKASTKKAKRGPGRPRKTVAKKRGPGRPRKKTTATRVTKKKARRGRPRLSAQEKIKRLIVERDGQILAAAGDPAKAYAAAANVDAFVEKVVKVVGG